ncbi:MAG: hypothetical protein WC756_02470 [Taibaiella sp.]|jgi:hypothetical protein
MNKIKYTVFSLALASALFTNKSNAQELISNTTPDNSPKIALSVNGGLAFSYTDVKPQKSAPIFGLGVAYFAKPYLHINLDVQKGWLKGGEDISVSGLMGSDNSFFTAGVTLRFLPLTLLSHQYNKTINFFSGIYVGAGGGIISNSVKSNTIISPDYGSLGDYSGVSFMVPIEGGINIPVAYFGSQNGKRIMINLNYRANLCFSDKIDGYVPIVEANKKNDAFNTLTAGVVFNF